MKILTASWHAASGEVVGAVARALKSRNHEVQSLALGPAWKSFQKASSTVPDRIVSDTSPSACKGYLSAYRPAVIVTGVGHPDKENPFALEQSIVLASTELGIPSVAILDINGLEAQRFSRVDPETKGILEAGAFAPSAICAVNEPSRAALIAAGIDGSRVHVTGNPYHSILKREYQSMLKEESVVSARVRERSGISGNAPLVLLIAGKMGGVKSMYSAAGGYDEAECVGKILGALRELSETIPLGVILRPHPALTEVDKAWAAGRGPNFNIFVDFPSSLTLQESIVASNLVIGTKSGSFVEARMADKPVVSFQPGAAADKADPTISVVAGEKGLLGRIRLALEGRLVQDQMAVLSDSVERVVSIVESFSNKH